MVKEYDIKEYLGVNKKLKQAIIDWFSDCQSLEITLEEVDKIKDKHQLLIEMLKNSEIYFEFRIRDPEYSFGRNGQHAIENYDGSMYDDDEIIFTGHWQIM